MRTGIILPPSSKSRLSRSLPRAYGDYLWIRTIGNGEGAAEATPSFRTWLPECVKDRRDQHEDKPDRHDKSHRKRNFLPHNAMISTEIGEFLKALIAEPPSWKAKSPSAATVGLFALLALPLGSVIAGIPANSVLPVPLLVWRIGEGIRIAFRRGRHHTETHPDP